MTGAYPHLLAEHYSLPEGMPALPPARDFLTSAGFGGAAALLAAIIVVAVVVFAVRSSVKRHELLQERQERHHAEVRDDEQRTARLLECRQRLAWVVDKGGIEPGEAEGATVGFGPELALTILQGIHDDAEQLGDATLAKAAAVQLNQLSRVLARQSGATAQFGAVGAVATDAPPTEKPESNGGPDGPPATGGGAPNPPARKAPAVARRHRQ